MPRRRKVIAFAAVPLAICVAAFAAGRDYVRGAAFVIQAAGLQGATRTVAEWTTGDVAESDTTVPWRGGVLRGRVYTPGAAAGPATLLVPGVHAGGIEEPRFVQFARDVASMGRVVVTAGLPDLEQYSITTRTTDMIEDAALWLARDSGLAPGGRVGLMGISFAGGLSIVAASRPALHGRVAYVLSFGGHGDLPRTLRYLCTGVQPDGSTRPPHDYGVVIILLGVADRLVPADQVQPLHAGIRSFLHASHLDMVDKAKAQVEFARARDLAAQLPEPARTFMTWVNDRNVAQLGPALLPHVSALGGDAALSAERNPVPRAPVHLLHGADDNVIPASESTVLAADLRKRGGRVSQLATPLITHAEVDHPPGVAEIWRLVRFWAAPL